MSGPSLKLRFLIAATLTIALALGVAGVALSEMFEHYVEKRVVAELETYLEQLAAGLEIADDGTPTIDADLPEPRFEQPLSGLYWQVTENGSAIESSRSLWDQSFDLPDLTELQTGASKHVEISGPSGTLLYVLVKKLAIDWNGKTRILTLASGIDVSEIQLIERSFNTEIGVMLGLLGIILLAAAWLQVTLGLRPLSVLRERLTAVISGSEKRLKGQYPNEVLPLVNELNQLLASQEDSIARARARAADLAHGLKTPLTVLGGKARELAAKGAGEAARDIDEQVEAMRRHIERELARARVSHARAPEPLELAPLVGKVVNTMRRMPRGEEILWHTQIETGLTARIDAVDGAELIGNLIDNARKWTRSEIRISGHRNGRGVELSLEDDGPGVPDDEMAAVLKRGHRLDSSVQGTGLGLAIASDIVEAYGADMALYRSPLGGLGIKLTLPPASRTRS
ncbi:MAG: HAMP domain-containing sensor histidine kinase [Hyphomicrobiaceae bacterium]